MTNSQAKVDGLGSGSWEPDKVDTVARYLLFPTRLLLVRVRDTYRIYRCRYSKLFSFLSFVQPVHVTRQVSKTMG